MDGRGKLCVVRLEGAGIVGDSTIPQTDDAVGILLRQFGVVRDHDHEAVFCHILQQLHDLDARLAVQCAGGLVGQQDVGVVDEGAGDGHALHLAARHLGGALVELVPEAHLPQRLGGTAAALSARHARDGQGQFDVGEDGLVGDEVIALEHEADGMVAVGVPVPVGVAAGGDAVDDELAAVVAVEAADDVEQRGLARAAGAEDGDKFAVAQVEADPVERCLCQIAGGVFLFDIDKLKHWPAFPAAERGSVCWPIPPGICGRRGKHSICLILSEEYEQFMS